jgi:hypothetical protein
MSCRGVVLNSSTSDDIGCNNNDEEETLCSKPPKHVQFHKSHTLPTKLIVSIHNIIFF